MQRFPISPPAGAEQWRRLGWNHWRFVCRVRQWSGTEFVRYSADSLRHKFEYRKRGRRNVGQRHCDIAKRCALQGGTTVRLVSSDPTIVRPPAYRLHSRRAQQMSILQFQTSAVAVATRVIIETGTDSRWLSCAANLADGKLLREVLRLHRAFPR
jgi:hypothetical protein